MIPIAARLLDHWPLKLLSVAFAVALWTFAVSGEQAEGVFTVPLVLTGIPPAVEVASVAVETVVVRVQARRRLLEGLHEGDFRVQVSLDGAQPGRFVARILPYNVVAPRGVKVLQVTPSQVRATLQAAAR